MTWEKTQGILIVIFLCAAIILGVISAFEHYAEQKRVCVWCKDKIFEEGTQYRKWWVHDRCSSILLLEYGWYRECNAGVINEICKELERRTIRH